MSYLELSFEIHILEMFEKPEETILADVLNIKEHEQLVLKICKSFFQDFCRLWLQLSQIIGKLD